MCLNVPIFHDGESTQLLEREKEINFYSLSNKYLLSPYIAGAGVEVAHQERGCGPGSYSLLHSDTISDRVHNGEYPSQEGEMHIDAFSHPCIQLK